MRTAFAGTPEFAQVAMQAMIDARFTPLAVLTQPDRPAGRGMRSQASPVKQLARAHGIPVLQPHGLRLDGRYASDAAAAQRALSALELDVLVVAAYGLILPRWLLDLPHHGCLNIHASLLPRWRGAAPIHRAIEAGDPQTGISIMQMDEGLDTGAIVSMDATDILRGESTGELHERLATLGGQCIVRALQQLAHGPLPSQPQSDSGISYAEKISRAESALDWQRPAHALARQVQAFNPFPAAQAQLETGTTPNTTETLKIWRAHALATEHSALPGTVLRVDREHGIEVACGERSALCLTELQRAGGKRLPVAQFLNGFAMAPGQRFVSTAAQP